MTETASKPISFRLSGDSLAALQERATQSDSSLGDAARDLALAAMRDGHAPAVDGETTLLVEALRDEVLSLRKDLATTVEMLLLNVAKIPEEQVREFVTKNLRG